jgi:hypothetical protein
MDYVKGCEFFELSKYILKHVANGKIGIAEGLKDELTYPALSSMLEKAKTDFVDGNGNVASFSKNSFEYRVLSDLNKLNNSKCNMIRGKLQDMMKSKHQHSIVNRTTSDGVGFNRPIDENLAEEYGKGTDTETGYNPFATKSVCADGGYVSCATLAHELLGHGWNNDQGLHESDNHRTENGIKFEEINAINVQNKVLVEYHQMPRSLVGKPGEAKQIPVNLLNHYYTTKPK